MKFIQRSILLMLPLVLILVSCVREESVNVNQDRIIGEYRLVYEADQDKTFVRATFKFGTTQLELSDPATISFEGDNVPWKPILAYYEEEFAGVTNTGTFSYTDLDGNTFDNIVTMASEIGLPASLTEISQGSAFELSWEGPAITAGEVITVTINGNQEGDAQAFIEADPGSTSIVLAQDKLAALGIGTARVFIERRANADIQQGTSVGGSIWSRYVVGPINVDITE